MSKFGILERPLRGWYLEDLCSLIDCCIIIHNMVINERCACFRFNDLNNDLNEEDYDGNSDNDEANVSVSIEQLTKYMELRNDLKTNINNNH